MKIKLIMAKTELDPITAWTAIKTIEVDIPLESKDDWNVIGAEWPEPEEEKER